MSLVVKENELPQELTPEEAVEAAYPNELADVAQCLQRGLAALVECDKELTPYVFLSVRRRLRDADVRCVYLDGRPRPDDPYGPIPPGPLTLMTRQIRELITGAVERRVGVLPHLDLLTGGQGAMPASAREIIPMLYENPELTWLGFADPSLSLPRVIENLFPHRVSLVGVPRDRLRHLVTRRESRKLGRELNPWVLHRYVSGVNVVRLRKILSTLDGPDYPDEPHKAFAHLRDHLREAPFERRNPFAHLRLATLEAHWQIPAVSLERDVGGYAAAKRTLREELLDLLAQTEQPADEARLRALTELTPRGLLVTGPAGVGKRLLAQAVAGALTAAFVEASARSLGEAEDGLRQVFAQARRAAPSVVLLDLGAGPSWPLMRELLSQMDALPREQLVLVVATAASVEALDPALTRAGAFELHLPLAYPEADDRREILRLHGGKLGLEFSDEALEVATARTAGAWGAGEPRWSGRRLEALCRSLARRRLLTNQQGPTTAGDVARALLG
jgi:cell division protease FtsH